MTCASRILSTTKYRNSTSFCRLHAAVRQQQHLIDSFIVFFISLRLRFYDSRWVRAAAHLISLLQLFYFNFNKKGEKLKFGNKKERTWNGQQPAKKSVQSIPRILFIESSTPCLGVHMCVIPILCWTKSSKNLCFINNTFRSNCRRGEKINWNTSSIKSKRTFNFTSPQTRKSEEFLNKQLFPHAKAMKQINLCLIIKHFNAAFECSACTWKPQDEICCCSPEKPVKRKNQKLDVNKS